MLFFIKYYYFVKKTRFETRLEQVIRVSNNDYINEALQEYEKHSIIN